MSREGEYPITEYLKYLKYNLGIECIRQVGYSQVKNDATTLVWNNVWDICTPIGANIEDYLKRELL